MATVAAILPLLENYTMNKERFPNTNMGWHQYYVKRYNKSQHSDAAYLATLHLFFHLAFGDTKIPA